MRFWCYVLALTLVVALTACAKHKTSKENTQTPTNTAVSRIDLGIGDKPTIPLKNYDKTPNAPITLIDGVAVSRQLISNLLSSTRPRGANGSNQRLDTSDSITLMSAGGGVLTIWATNVGNWVWGYAPRDSLDLGNARQWKILSRANGKVSFVNLQTNTCLSAYKNGVIHMPCDSDNPAQIWNLNTFANRATQIQNQATNTCLQTPLIRKTRALSIFLVPCVSASNPLRDDANIEQQWYITAPLVPTTPIFFTN